MRKNVRNDKVVKAITIGLAAMLTVTSTPVTVLADEPASAEQPESQPEPQPQAEPQSQAQPEAPAQSNPEPAPAPVQSTPAPEVQEASAAIEQAAAVVEASQAETGSQVDALIAADLNAAQEIINNSEAINDQDINAALVNTDAATANLSALEATLNSKELESDDKDKNGLTRKQYIVNRDENGNIATDENGTPQFGQAANENGETLNYVAKEQLSGQYGPDGRSVQGVYEDGVEFVQAALGTTNETSAKKNIEDATKMLDTGITKFDNSTEKLRKAREEYAQAEQAAKEAEQALQDTQKLAASLKDAGEAAEKINEAKKNAERLAEARDQYYALMLQYFSGDTKSEVFDENGVLDIEASVAKAKENGSKVLTGENGAGDATFQYGRELMRQLIEYKLLEEGAYSIQFGKYAEGEKAGSAVTLKDKDSRDVTSITKDKNGNDKIGKYVNLEKLTWENYNPHLGDKSDSVDGRNNHIKVDYTYKDEKGVEHKETKYYNYIVKSLEYENIDDFNTGVIFVSEITKSKGSDGKDVWTYTPYNSEGTEFLDNYNMLKAAAEAKKDEQAAIEAAADEINKLKDELNTLQTRVATNNNKLAELKEKLDRAEAAYKESKQGLEDLNDLIEAASNKLGVEYEKRIIKGIDDVEPKEEAIEEGVAEEANTGNGSTGGTVSEGPVSQAEIADGSEDAPAASASTDGTVVPGITPSETTTYTIPGISTIASTVAASLGSGTTIDLGSATATIPGFDSFAAGTGTQEAVLGTAEETVDTTAVASEVEEKVADDSAAPEMTNGIRNTTRLDDNAVPLAAALPQEEGVKISWWWLLIIALLGATGKKMYDDHMEKKRAVEMAADDENKD